MAVDFLGTLAGVQLAPEQREAMLQVVTALPPAATMQTFLDVVSADAGHREVLAPVVGRLISLPARYGRLFGETPRLKSV